MIVTKERRPTALLKTVDETPRDVPNLMRKVSQRVLLVEDDQNSARSLSAVLRHAGYDVMSVDDGQFGLECAEMQEPDLVLLDLGLLPGMHGFKVLEELAKRGVATQVIAMTSSTAPHLEHRARALGAVGVLRKPIRPREMVSAIEDMLA